MLKLSIIVPIYNVEPYLRKCVDSLLMQDLDPTEYEIILVDDGSPDGCPAICDEYAQTLHPSGGSRKGANIRVLHQPNGGLSAARNSGLRMAQGKYVQFVDSDDYLEPNVLGGLVAQMEREDLDVLRFDYQNVRIVRERERESERESERYEVFEPNKTPRNIDKRTDVVDGITYLNERMGYACYAVMYMVKRSLLVSGQRSDIRINQSPITNHKSPIFFTEGIHFEDVDWTPRMLLAAKRVNSTTTIVYNYLHRIGSITKQGSKNINKILSDNLTILTTLQTLKSQFPMCFWLNNMISLIVLGEITTIAQYQFGRVFGMIRQYKKKQFLPLVIADQGFTYRRKALLVNLFPMLYCIYINLSRRR